MTTPWLFVVAITTAGGSNRVGLAWDVAGSGRTIVRPGAGIFYDQYYMYLTRCPRFARRLRESRIGSVTAAAGLRADAFLGAARRI